jgi:DNA-binding CsgD family transcriptional regulator
MKHAIILFQVFSLLVGTLISSYFFHASKKLKDPIVKQFYYYTFFSALTILEFFLYAYLGTNLAEERRNISYYILTYAIFLPWCGVLYVFMNFVFQLSGNKSPLFIKILIGIIILAVTLFLFSGANNYQITILLFSVYLKRLAMLSLVCIIICTLVYFLVTNKYSVKEKGFNNKILFGLLLPGYIVYFISWLTTWASGILVCVALLYLPITFLWWFRKYFLKNRIITLFENNPEPVDLIENTYKITSREKDILTLIIEGKSNKEIEQILFISASTIRNHISAMYSKIGINSRGQLMNLVLKLQKGEN